MKEADGKGLGEKKENLCGEDERKKKIRGSFEGRGQEKWMRGEEKEGD